MTTATALGTDAPAPRTRLPPPRVPCRTRGRTRWWRFPPGTTPGAALRHLEDSGYSPGGYRLPCGRGVSPARVHPRRRAGGLAVLQDLIGPQPRGVEP